jgi:hypothetical protein
MTTTPAPPLRLLAFVGAALLAGAVPVGAHAAPPNDALADAAAIGALPVEVQGSTKGARLEATEPSASCSRMHGSVWYRLRARRRQAIVLRLKNGGALDSAIAVYRQGRTRLTPVTCRRSDGKGRAVLAFRVTKGSDYLIALGDRPGSAPGSFSLRIAGSERQTRPPGSPLPVGGVRDTVDAVLDHSDAWTVHMTPGQMYRLNLTSLGGCVSLSIHRANVYSFAREPLAQLDCGGYTTFTPGPDGGGPYSLVVGSERRRPGRQLYRLLFAPATADDGAPGIALTNGDVIDQTLFGRGIDVVDLYRFAVPRAGELTTVDLDVRPNVGFDLALLRESGGRVVCACAARGTQRLREHLVPGHYFVVVRSRAKSGGRYRLHVLVRDVTTTDLLVSGARFAEAVPGTAVTFDVHVSQPGPGGPVGLNISRRDPLAGWQFFTALRARVGPTGLAQIPWTPPTVGLWSAVVRFLGTPFSSFSESRSVRLHVTEPLG